MKVGDRVCCVALGGSRRSGQAGTVVEIDKGRHRNISLVRWDGAGGVPTAMYTKYLEVIKPDFDPGEGWREETHPARVSMQEDSVVVQVDGRRRYYVREDSVPPLPTERDTLILATTEPPERHRFLFDGEWWASLTYCPGQSFDSVALRKRITGFEVLAQPLGLHVSEYEAAVRRETVKTVIDRIRKTKWLSDELLDDIEKEFDR